MGRPEHPPASQQMFTEHSEPAATLTTRRTMAGQEGAWPLAALS